MTKYTFQFTNSAKRRMAIKGWTQAYVEEQLRGYIAEEAASDGRSIENWVRGLIMAVLPMPGEATEEATFCGIGHRSNREKLYEDPVLVVGAMEAEEMGTLKEGPFKGMKVVFPRLDEDD